VPDGSQWLASGTLYSKNMLISGKNRAVASTYFKADATAPGGAEGYEIKYINARQDYECTIWISVRFVGFYRSG
jgi:hypothetical protein